MAQQILQLSSQHISDSNSSIVDQPATRGWFNKLTSGEPDRSRSNSTPTIGSQRPNNPFGLSDLELALNYAALGDSEKDTCQFYQYVNKSKDIDTDCKIEIMGTLAHRYKHNTSLFTAPQSNRDVNIDSDYEPDSDIDIEESKVDEWIAKYNDHITSKKATKQHKAEKNVHLNLVSHQSSVSSDDNSVHNDAKYNSAKLSVEQQIEQTANQVMSSKNHQVISMKMQIKHEREDITYPFTFLCVKNYDKCISIICIATENVNPSDIKQRFDELKAHIDQEFIIGNSICINTSDRNSYHGRIWELQQLLKSSKSDAEETIYKHVVANNGIDWYNLKESNIEEVEEEVSA